MVQLISKGIHKIKNEKQIQKKAGYQSYFSSTLTHIMLKLLVTKSFTVSGWKTSKNTCGFDSVQMEQTWKWIYNIQKLYTTYINI